MISRVKMSEIDIEHLSLRSRCSFETSSCLCGSCSTTVGSKKLKMPPPGFLKNTLMVSLLSVASRCVGKIDASRKEVSLDSLLNSFYKVEVESFDAYTLFLRDPKYSLSKLLK